jgi:hypothetical protein
LRESQDILASFFDEHLGAVPGLGPGPLASGSFQDTRLPHNV